MLTDWEIVNHDPEGYTFQLQHKTFSHRGKLLRVSCSHCDMIEYPSSKYIETLLVNSENRPIYDDALGYDDMRSYDNIEEMMSSLNTMIATA